MDVHNSNIKTLKMNFKKILYKNNLSVYKPLFNIISETNTLFFNLYHFLRFVLLKKFEQNEIIPELTVEYLRCLQKSIIVPSCGPKCKHPLFTETCEFFKEFSNITGVQQQNISNISYIVTAEIKKIITAYENNVKNNFYKYLFKWINEQFDIPKLKKYSKEEFNKLSDDDKVNFRKYNAEIKPIRIQFFKEIRLVKVDIITGSSESLKKYHNFISETRTKFFPEITGNVLEKINEAPLKYLHILLRINRDLENKDLKLFQPLPLRTDLSDKYISIDTGSLGEIFQFSKEKQKECELSNQMLWDKYFNFNWKRLKIKNYVFNKCIQTDGKSVSILFISQTGLIKKTKQNTVRSEGRNKSRNLTLEEKQKLKIDKDKQSAKNKQKNAETKAKEKEEFNKKTKEEQNKLKQERRLNMNEFSHIEDILNDTVLENKEMNEWKINKKKELIRKLEEGKLNCSDVGKRAIATIIKSDGSFYEYRNRRRKKETKMKKYTNLRKNKLDKIINETDSNGKFNDLRKTETKTTYIVKFNKYLKAKYEFINLIGNKKRKYSDYMNKLKWYSYVNNRRHEDRLLNEFEEEFGKDSVFILGDWSMTDHIKGAPAPNMSFKRLLQKRFEVYLIDEYGTSKNYFKNENECGEMKHPTVGDRGKELYSVFTYKMSNDNRIYVNRDKNAAKNMSTIVKYLMEGKERPEVFKRKINNSTGSVKHEK